MPKSDSSDSFISFGQEITDCDGKEEQFVHCELFYSVQTNSVAVIYHYISKGNVRNYKWAKHTFIHFHKEKYIMVYYALLYVLFAKLEYLPISPCNMDKIMTISNLAYPKVQLIILLNFR